jgi:hypothetical protein
VAPRDAQSERVRLQAPREEGSYELLVRLVQVGDGPLDACGVQPLRIPVRIAPAR